MNTKRSKKMTKYITVKLTEEQLSRCISALELDQNSDYPMSDPTNAFIQRIIGKIRKALAEAKS